MGESRTHASQQIAAVLNNPHVASLVNSRCRRRGILPLLLLKNQSSKTLYRFAHSTFFDPLPERLDVRRLGIAARPHVDDPFGLGRAVDQDRGIVWQL